MANRKSVQKSRKRTYTAAKKLVAAVLAAGLLASAYFKGFFNGILKDLGDGSGVPSQTGTGLELSSSPKDDTILEKSYYTIGYNKNSKQANWVAYYLSSARLEEGEEGRSDDFREDDSIRAAWRSLLSDYRKSGYDRGHLAPAADFRFSKTAMSETFLLSNISPQLHEFNAGIWLVAEKATRRNAWECGDLYVVTGPIFNSDAPSSYIGESKVWVPDAFFKALLSYNDNEKKAIGFIIPHRKGKFSNLAEYAVSVDEIEKTTGIDLFYNLPDDEEEMLEASFDISEWTMREYQF